MHILSTETDNCPSWISGRERMTVENISWSISTKECCRPRMDMGERVWIFTVDWLLLKTSLRVHASCLRTSLLHFIVKAIKDDLIDCLIWNPTLYFELQRGKMYRLTCGPNGDANQPAHPRSLVSLRCPHEETLHPWLSKMRPVKILIRLRECAGWSESSLGAHVQRSFFWRCGPFIIWIVT